LRPFEPGLAKRAADAEAARKDTGSIMKRVSPKGPIDYRLGTVYAIATAVLVSLQEPFSALAARSLGSLDFIAFT
jgi:hypothetical protein